MNWKRIHDNTADRTDRQIIDVIMEKFGHREPGLAPIPFSNREG